MTMYVNYDDVLSQLRGLGLLVETLDIGTPKPRRVKVEGDREKRGWYWLHEWRSRTGDFYIVGTYGVWHGTDSNTHKVQLKNVELNDEEKKALKARIAADRKRADAMREREAERAAVRAEKMWLKLTDVEGATCEYLAQKKVRAHGARITGKGTLVVPLLDTSGRIHGLQFIGPEVKKKLGDENKQFWPYGMNPIGRFFMIGAPGAIVVIVEGFATGASVFEAMEGSVAVVVAFNANNLAPVAEAIRKRYRTAKILICADDDFASKGNPGVSLAQSAALPVYGEWLAPLFEGDAFRADLAAANIDWEAEPKVYKQQVERVRAGRKKLTDFNDLHVAVGLHAVRSQIEAKLEQLEWARTEPVRAVDLEGAGGTPLKPITSVQELFDRFAIIYGHNKSLFDFQERMLLSIEDMKNACSGREIWRTWMESPEKKIVRIENVGFDPSGDDPEITCNLWDGWPMQPKKGKCELLLGLLEYLCTNEQNHADLYTWLLKWLAYPLQHPGAKMRTAIVVHGPQRVGKNLFFESYMEIYGKYGQVIDQDALEDKYNDCFSRKLLLIADEVIARQELYHVKNKLKGMITGRRIRINPKNVKSYWETNHCNIIFLSNETQPLVLERDDGRHVVLWTPKKLSKPLYDDIHREIQEGGIAALYDYLLNLDLGDFNEHTPPPMTAAKRELMDLSMDSTERFWIDWSKGHIDPVPVVPTRSTHLYAFYREYCGRQGYPRYAPEPKFLAEIGKRTDAKKAVRWYLIGSEKKQATFIFPPGVEQPVDKTEQLWLGECVDEFTNGVAQWREEGEARR